MVSRTEVLTYTDGREEEATYKTSPGHVVFKEPQTLCETPRTV